MPETPNRVQEVFLAAVELTDPTARAAYLTSACETDGALRARVEALLRAHDQPDSLLDRPAVPPPEADPGVCTIAHEADLGATEEVPLAFLGPATRPDSLGRIGHYEVLQVLGKGGFGIVFRAFDDVLHRVVAVKVLAPELAATSPARKRFLREARSSAQVRHENVVQVYEVGEQPLPYLVMEFIPGETLQQRLDRVGPVEPVEVVRIGRQIAEGLAAAHATGLVHRDIKPGNILLEGGVGRVKITDFGLARAADDASLSQSGIIAGTPMYMAPEQAKGEALDQRADLFSLGSVLYQMATGRPPFRANTTLAVLKRVAEDTPRPIREVIPETPQWLCDIIAKLHAKRPEDRFQSAREVADVLADCEAQLREHAKLTDLSRIPHGKTPRGSRGWAAAAAVLLLGVIALATTEFTGITHFFRASSTPNEVTKSDGQPPVVGDPKTPSDPDRRAAEYVLSLGGTVRVKGREQVIKAAADLPRGPFRLTFFDLRDTPADDAGLAAFAGCKNLTALGLQNTRVSDTGLAYLKESKNWTFLNLGGTKVTDAGLRYFKDCQNLSFLSLLGTNITDEGLANFKQCKNLNRLALCTTAVGDQGAAYLSGQTDLDTLDLRETRITDAGLAHFRDNKKLILLLVGGPEVTDAGVANFEGCRSLDTLGLTGTRVTDAGLTAVVRDSKNLRKLHLDGTPITDAGLEHLVGLGQLRDLTVERTKVTAKGVEALGKALPRCKITWDGGVLDLQAKREAEIAAKAEKAAFVVLAGGQEWPFDTLAEAVQAASDHDTIEVRGNGPFVSDGVNIRRPLVIRAGKGFVPSIVLSRTAAVRNTPLLEASAPLVLEGLELRRVGPVAAVAEGRAAYLLTATQGGSLHVANCRLIFKASSPHVGWPIQADVKSLAVRNSMLSGNCDGTSLKFASGRRLDIENCISVIGGLGFTGVDQDIRNASIRLHRNTLVGNCVTLNTCGEVTLTDLPPVRLELSENVAFWAPTGRNQGLLYFAVDLLARPFSADALEAYLLRLVRLDENRNVYRTGAPMLRHAAGVKRAQDRADWDRFWGQKDTGSVEGDIRFKGGDLVAKALAAPEALTPDDFRLRSDSAGYRAGKDGKDLGADVDLVGPGPPYERWRQTPAYQQWLVETKQLKK